MNTEAQALLWPQLLYAMAQLTDPKSDNATTRWIWVEAPDVNTLRLSATIGTAILVAKIAATHTLQDGAYTLDPKDHLKKPSLTACNRPQLVTVNWQADRMPFSVGAIAKGMKVEQGLAPASLDPTLAAKFFRAAAAVCQRVDLSTYANAVFLRCPHPEVPGEVRGMLANLQVMK